MKLSWFETRIVDPLMERSGGWFTLLPSVPWGSRTFSASDLLSDLHAQPLAAALKERHPVLYAEWYHRVYNSTRQVLEFEQQLKQWQEERDSTLQQKESLSIRIQESFGEMKTDRKTLSHLEREQQAYRVKSVFAYLLSPWLAPVLFHTMTEMFADALQDGGAATLILYPMLGCLAAAVSVGAKVAVQTAVKHSYIPLEDELPRPTMPLQQMFRSPVFWTVVVLGLEVGFGAPFIVRLLDRAIRGNLFWQLAIISGTSLGPAINMAMAWALGREGARLSHLEAKEEARLATILPAAHYSRTIEFDTSKLGELRVHIKTVDERVRELEIKLKIASRRARIDYQKWLKKVERVMHQSQDTGMNISPARFRVVQGRRFSKEK